jgi:hypothetical protein
MSKKTLLRVVILLLLSVCLYAEEAKGKGVCPASDGGEIITIL